MYSLFVIFYYKTSQLVRHYLIIESLTVNIFLVSIVLLLIIIQMAIIEEILTEDEKTAELEQLKKEGNTNFASGSYEKAVELYTVSC